MNQVDYGLGSDEKLKVSGSVEKSRVNVETLYGSKYRTGEASRADDGGCPPQELAWGDSGIVQ